MTSLIRCFIGLFALGGILGGAMRPVAAEQTLLTLVANVALPGGDTRFDYESLDSKTDRLFLAHLGASEIVVFDVRRDRVVATIPNIDHVHGVLAVPELGRVYASATGTNEIAVIDAHTLNVVARVPGGSYPDGMAYDPVDRRLFVSDEHGDTETVIDTRTNERIATIPLGGDVGNSQYDARMHRIDVNVQTRGELVAIDPVRLTIVKRSFVHGCAGNHGLLIDERQHIAFIACEDNARLIVFDLNANVQRQSFAVGDDPDVLAYDRQRGMLYVAAENGPLAMFESTRAGVRAIGSTDIGTNAHVVAVDERTHRIYLPVLGGGNPRMLVFSSRPPQRARR